MILHNCDRCGKTTTPDKLYEVELVCTPRRLDGGMDTDKAIWKCLGDLCADCTDVLEPLAEAVLQPPPAATGQDGLIP